MVDENGKQTITNDGATVMKVRATTNLSSNECKGVCNLY